MKKIFLSLVLIILPIVLFADDSTYISSGAQLMPMQNTQIELTYERLDFKYIASDVEVTAYLEFTNNFDDQELLIGFETPAYEEEGQDAEDLYYIPRSGITDFKVYFNDQQLKWNMYFLTNADHETHTLVYTFKAKFKKGFNRILHSYKIGGLQCQGLMALYAYRLSTGNRWANKKIDRIDINVDMGTNSSFILPVYIDQEQNELNWQIKGRGQTFKTYDGWLNWAFLKNNLKGYRHFVLRNGTVSTSITNLRACYDLEIMNYQMARPYNERNASEYVLFDRYYSKALQCYREKRDAEAIDYYEKAFQYGQCGEAYLNYANSLSNIKERLADAIAAYEKAIELNPNLKKISYYNMACAYSKMGDLRNAYCYLSYAISNGYNNIKHIESDSDLINLRADQNWAVWWESEREAISTNK